MGLPLLQAVLHTEVDAAGQSGFRGGEEENDDDDLGSRTPQLSNYVAPMRGRKGVVGMGQFVLV